MVGADDRDYFTNPSGRALAICSRALPRRGLISFSPCPLRPRCGLISLPPVGLAIPPSRLRKPLWDAQLCSRCRLPPSQVARRRSTLRACASRDVSGVLRRRQTLRASHPRRPRDAGLTRFALTDRPAPRGERDVAPGLQAAGRSLARAGGCTRRSPSLASVS